MGRYGAGNLWEIFFNWLYFLNEIEIKSSDSLRRKEISSCLGGLDIKNGCWTAIIVDIINCKVRPMVW